MQLRAAAQVASLLLFVPAILYFGRPLLLPLALAGVLAMVVAPLVQWLRSRRMTEGVAIALAATTLLLAVFLVAGLLMLQVAQVISDWPKISESLADLHRRGQGWLVRTVGVSQDQIQRTLQGLLEQGRTIAAVFFGTMFGALATAFLTFVLVILLLLERARIAWAIAHAAAPGRRRDIERLLDEMVMVSNQYLVGKLKVMGVMTVVYVIAFSVAGVPYAPFLALLIALSSIIPYVGNLAGGVLAIILALAASGGTSALTVLLVVVLAQPFENYVLEPLVVGRQISLNPLITVVAVLAFGVVWGVAGAVIALPIAGMIKVGLDHAPSAESAAALMSDEPPGA